MRTLICCIGVTLLCQTGRAFADMLIVFNNRVLPSVNAPVSRPDGTGAGVGASAQLVLVNKDGSLTPLPPVTKFRTTSDAAKYFVQPDQVTIKGVPAGGLVTLRLRAWEGKDFASSKLRGESADFELKNNAAVNNLVGLKEFKLGPASVK